MSSKKPDNTLGLWTGKTQSEVASEAQRIAQNLDAGKITKKTRATTVGQVFKDASGNAARWIRASTVETLDRTVGITITERGAVLGFYRKSDNAYRKSDNAKPPGQSHEFLISLVELDLLEEAIAKCRENQQSQQTK